MGISCTVEGRVAEIVMANPPVNALTVAGWFELARLVREAGENPDVSVVILAADGKGWNAGVDIKEMQRTKGYDALIGANRGCYEAFAAVYHCKVPVIAAVHEYCLGGGIGLVGNADLIVASDDATFGLPEVDRGALGAATHLMRLVPQHKMRAMVYTATRATAAELHQHGSVLEIVPKDRLRERAREIARDIAKKSPAVIRAAKQALNGIDPMDVNKSYRFEQGFTFELNLSGVADEARDAFVEKREAKFEKLPMNKLVSLDEAVGAVKSGMPRGIGGWGSRRKPMSFVRALCRSDVRDLTVVAYGGPEVGLLAAYGKIKKLVFGFVSLDSIPLEPHFRAARQRGDFAVLELDEGMLQWGLYAAALRLPFLPTRAGLGSDVMTHAPELKTVKSPYGDEELVAMPALALDVAVVHTNRADALGNGQLLGPDPFFDDLFLGAATTRIVTTERVVATEELVKGGPLSSLKIHRGMVDQVVACPNGAHFTSCEPDYGRDEKFQKEYATAAADPALWKAFAARYVDVGEAEYQAAVGGVK